MNKGELINEVSKKLEAKKDTVGATIDAIFEAISNALEKKDSVTLVGFGTFKVIERKARKGRNPQTGEEMNIEARKVPKFVAGKNLKEKIK